MIDDLPPEVRVARKQLRQVAPLSGSKRRVYQKVMASRVRGRSMGTRAALIGICLAASTSAMALGYRWVANRTADSSPTTVSVAPSSRGARVPHRPKNSAAIAEPRVIEEAAEPVQSRVPAVANSTAPRALSVEATSFAGRQRPAAESDKGRDIVPPAMPAAEASELSQQVRDYHAAVASMRANPQLALARLQAYRSKWPQSAIGEEVELRVIEALLALGRQHDAANAAVAFLRRYPRSARAAELRRLAEESSRPGVFED